MDEAATRTLTVTEKAGERVPGFGRRYHTKDPRTAQLFPEKSTGWRKEQRSHADPLPNCSSKFQLLRKQ